MKSAEFPGNTWEYRSFKLGGLPMHWRRRNRRRRRWRSFSYYDVQRKKEYHPLKSGIWLRELVIACGGSLCERVASGPQNPTLSWLEAEIISPDSTANIFNCILELLCVRFVQHYLVSLLLNLYTSFENRTHCFTLPRDLLLNRAQISSKSGYCLCLEGKLDLRTTAVGPFTSLCPVAQASLANQSLQQTGQ